jgi:molybdenum cofactor synthesis domain-containing protein
MFRKLLSLDEAKIMMAKSFQPKPLGTEHVSLLEACGRVLAENVISPINVPPFDRSTVDGYAVKAEDTFGAYEAKPVKLRLCGTVNVGEPPKIMLENGMAAGIATGAPLPKGADAVVMIENTERENDHILVYKSVVENENVMKAGTDIHKGENILKLGKHLTWKDLGILAALGFEKVRVYRKPKVVIISTGAEIVAPGQMLSPGKIYDINGYTLGAATARCGAIPMNFGVFPDNFQILNDILKKALETADVVITSGGVSVGPKDLIPKVLDSLGSPGVIVHGIAIKPGKPTTIALVDEKPVFALPGHPTSALLTFYLLVRPVLVRLAGRRADEILKTVKALTGVRVFSAKGRRTFVMVKLVREADGKFVAFPIATGESGAITTLAKADGFITVYENQQFVDAGEEVTVSLFSF